MHHMISVCYSQKTRVRFLAAMDVESVMAEALAAAAAMQEAMVTSAAAGPPPAVTASSSSAVDALPVDETAARRVKACAKTVLATEALERVVDWAGSSLTLAELSHVAAERLVDLVRPPASAGGAGGAGGPRGGGGGGGAQA